MKIADLVYQFCAAKIGETFRASELGAYIATHRTDVSPESLNRTLRELRNNGSVHYFADGKGRSIYHVTGVC